MSRMRRIPGARWWMSQGQKLRSVAAADHARAVADHIESREPAPSRHPSEGPEVVRGSGTDGSGGPARAN